MIYLEKFKIFESKNYGDVYHSLWRVFDHRKAVETTLNILEKGFKFSDHGVWEPMLSKDNVYSRKHWDFLKSDKLKTISVTRDSSTKDRYPITFVLDGNEISNNYKIEPCNLRAPSEIFFTKNPKSKKDSSWYTYNSRYSSEEKILSKKDYLEPKFIKEIIINKYKKVASTITFTEEEIELIKLNANNIKITVIDKGPELISYTYGK
jgi:hypothetical protein